MFNEEYKKQEEVEFVSQVEDFSEEEKKEIEKYLEIANRYCAISVTKKGAMDSYPTLDEFLEII